ncbi:hypothetical protein GGF50DRAFT_68825, partial [Schizophyllum commune]
RERAVRESTATALYNESTMLCAYCPEQIKFQRRFDLASLYKHMRDAHESYGMIGRDGVLDDTGAAGVQLGPRLYVQQPLNPGEGRPAKRGAGYVGRVTFDPITRVMHYMRVRERTHRRLRKD